MFGTRCVIYSKEHNWYYNDGLRCDGSRGFPTEIKAWATVFGSRKLAKKTLRKIESRFPPLFFHVTNI